MAEHRSWSWVHDKLGGGHRQRQWGEKKGCGFKEETTKEMFGFSEFLGESDGCVNFFG